MIIEPIPHSQVNKRKGYKTFGIPNVMHEVVGSDLQTSIQRNI